MTVRSVRMLAQLVERLDAFAAEHGYTGRSEMVRKAARALLGEFDEPSLKGQELLGVVILIFDYRSTAVEQDRMTLRHEHDGLLASTVHTHEGDRYCVELYILERPGRARGVRPGRSRDGRRPLCRLRRAFRRRGGRRHRRVTGSNVGVTPAPYRGLRASLRPP